MVFLWHSIAGVRDAKSEFTLSPNYSRDNFWSSPINAIPDRQGGRMDSIVLALPAQWALKSKIGANSPGESNRWVCRHFYKKFELMLTRRAKDYSSSCSQIVFVYLQPFRRNSLLKCAPQPKIAKINETLYSGSLGFFKVIDVNMTKKLVTGWDRQHAHAYLQPFSRKTGQQR